MVTPVPPSSSSRRAARRRRRQERGAAVFVVVLAITMLTAVGLFAAYSATQMDKAIGYERLARQTQELAEYGTLLASAELGAGTAQAYMDQLRAGTQTCYANADLKTMTSLTTVPCFKMFYYQLNERSKQMTGESLSKDPAGDKEDVVGNGDTRGDFVIELTDPGPIGVPLAGTDLSGTSTNPLGYLKVTSTTTAQLRPAGLDACVNAIATLSGQQAMRAHLIVGPVQR
jgi:hypothetical protein